jgi:hypothetical protein
VVLLKFDRIIMKMRAHPDYKEVMIDRLSVTLVAATFAFLFSALDPANAADRPTALPAAAQTPTLAAAKAKVVMVEDFESYASDEQLAKAWYRPPHGGSTHQTLDSTVKSGGNHSLKWEYSTTRSPDRFYSASCRVSKWDLSGCNALEFWLKPDGSGRALLVELNISNRQGRNIHDLWDYTYVPRKDDTTGRIVTVPFAKLVKNAKYADSPDTSPVFRPEALIEVALCIGGRNDEPGEGVYYFDDFRGVSTASASIPKPATPPASASELVDLQPLTERILMLHFNDGHVQHHQRGEPRSAEKVFTDPLDVVAASRPESYSATSTDDPAYREKQSPLGVGRKSKGTDFAWFVDKWENGRAVNNRPDHTKEHWLYLELPAAMQSGRTYTVNTGRLAKNGTNWTITFDMLYRIQFYAAWSEPHLSFQREAAFRYGIKRRLRQSDLR